LRKKSHRFGGRNRYWVSEIPVDEKCTLRLLCMYWTIPISWFKCLVNWSCLDRVLADWCGAGSVVRVLLGSEIFTNFTSISVSCAFVSVDLCTAILSIDSVYWRRFSTFWYFLPIWKYDLYCYALDPSINWLWCQKYYFSMIIFQFWCQKYFLPIWKYCIVMSTISKFSYCW